MLEPYPKKLSLWKTVLLCFILFFRNLGIIIIKGRGRNFQDVYIHSEMDAAELYSMSNKFWIKHLMYPITLSINPTGALPVVSQLLLWKRCHTCPWESSTNLVDCTIKDLWELGCVADPIARNMFNSCNICYLNKRLVRVGPVGWVITKIKHPVSPRAEAPDDGLNCY